jgi:hypothetical protein
VLVLVLDSDVSAGALVVVKTGVGRWQRRLTTMEIHSLLFPLATMLRHFRSGMLYLKCVPWMSIGLAWQRKRTRHCPGDCQCSLTDSLACLSLVARIGDSDAEECCRRAIQSHSGGSRTFPVHAAFRHTDIAPFPPPSCPLSPVADLPHKLSSAATTKTSLFEHLQSRPYSMPKYLNGAPFCASQKPRHNCCVKSSTRVCEVPLRRPVLIELVDAKQRG